MRRSALTLTLGVVLALLVLACESSVFGPDGPTDESVTGAQADARGAALNGPFSEFGGLVFDIAALPNGNLLVATTAPDFSGNAIMEIGRTGIEHVTEIPKTGSGINGLAPLGQRNFFVTSGGNDLAEDAALWRVSQGNTRLVADVESFIVGDWDRDAGFDGNELEDAGPYPDRWKDFRCETLAAFSHGPQTNPYNIATLSGSEVLIGDAANNGVLWAKTNGQIEVVAFVDPPEDSAGDWMVLGYVNGNGVPTTPDDPDAIECFVEPVPNAVTVGPDGAYYVGELTGSTPENFTGDPSPMGLARVWRIDPGARNVVCPIDDECEEVISDLTTVIDLEFGPDGKLYVVEFEHNGFLAAFGAFDPAGGALKRCDVDTGACTEVDVEVDGGLLFPGAITFDKWDNLWLVNNVFDATVLQVDY